MQTTRKPGKPENKREDYRMEYIYKYLFESNIQASAKGFPYIAEGILYAIDHPSCSFDSILSRLALTHEEPAERIRGSMSYTIKTNTGSSAKAFLFNTAAYLRMNISKEEDRKGRLIAFSS